MAVSLRHALASVISEELLRLNPGNHFELLKLYRVFEHYDFPFIDTFNTASYDLSYKAWNMYNTGDRNAGSLMLEKTTNGSMSRFSLQILRNADNGQVDKSNPFVYVVKGEVIASIGRLPQLISWHGSSMIRRRSSDVPYLMTDRVIEGSVNGHNLVLTEAGKTKTMVYHGNYLSWKWGIIDLVQLMAEQSMKSLRLSVLDEMDMLYQDQSLVFRNREELKYGESGSMAFKVYDLTGDGVVPTSYWVDNHGRVAFIVSGMEAYMILLTKLH